MTSIINFYYSRSNFDIDRAMIACRLAGTAFSRGHRVFVATADASRSEEYDRLLWTFPQLGFVPHAVVASGAADMDKYPVLIGHEPPAAEFDDVLVMTHDSVPGFVKQFDRIVDPVDATKRELELASRRHQQYVDLTGITPKAIDI